MSGILPPGMDGRTHHGGGQKGTSQSAADTLHRSTESEEDRDRNAHTTVFKPNVNVHTTTTTTTTTRTTIRTVTPEPAENGYGTMATSLTQASQVSQGYGTTSPQASPRSIPGGERRRRGIVFNDACGESYDSSESSPPQHQRSSLRPRTHTMDGALALRQHTQPSSLDTRHRVGSFSSSGSTPFTDIDVRTPTTVLESVGYPSVATSRGQDLKTSVSSTKPDKKSANRRLIKRASSRPTSPLISPPPSVDSLPLPIPTDDANKVLLLMKTLCGRMKGEVEYQGEPNGPWYSGICYIDEERGSLLFDSGQNGPFHIPIVGDLRGCRVLPLDDPGNTCRCLELLNPKAGVEILLRPLVAEELDLWLAALLCWQQLRPTGVRLPSGRGSNSPSATSRADLRRRGSSAAGSATSRDANIIKVGKVMLWDKGTATSPRAIVKRPSTRDLRGTTTSWVRVSCILQDNGEFKLVTENDVTVLSVIELSQLSRCAVQQLDRSVLDEEYCIAIFPIYSSTSRQLSIFRPVYIALDSRVLFEVWFVLLRAFAIPELYGIEPSTGQALEITNFHFDNEFEGQTFRLEKSIQVRITEAKLRRPDLRPEHHDKHSRHDRDPLTGNYLAEVILDGEVRARTTTQTDTNKPFWREAVQFTELSTTLPYLSVVLKRVDGNLESFSHQLQASLGLPKTGNLTEVMCGAVDIPLDRLERGKDHEQWHEITDERNETIGSMYVKINHEELVVLMAEDYKPLSELLHKFSIGLTSQIASALPQQLRRVAEIFINIFQVSTSSTEWLLALVEEEIDGVGGQNSLKKIRFSRRLKSNESTNSASDREQLVRDMGRTLAGEANLLFRGNSLLTQALEFHMRRLGKEYLEETLSDKIFEINEINPNCEVDPSKLQHPDDINQHWTQLMQLTTEVWRCIAFSATKLPPELRQILKYIRAVAEDRYGDFLRSVTYTSVSGFLFLRFICPAILNPKLFGLLRDNPRPRAQRTLTLIAKGLQALGNLSTFGKKESWMEPMNKFLNIQRQPFKDFIDQVCSIPTERTGATLPATYMTPITILSRLSKTSREGFPALPYLIDHARNFAALVKLWLEYHHAAAADSQIFEGELAQFHNLCVALQTRADECMAKIEVVRAAESGSVTTDDIIDGLEKSSLMDSVNLAYGSPPIWVDNDPYHAPGSSGSEMEGGDRSIFRELKFGGSREASALRQVSDGSEASNTGGTLRRNGRNPRTFLSGLISGKKDKHSKGDPPTSNPSATVREKSRDKGEDREKRGFLGGFTESWQSSENSKH
ncbi:GTPase-activator protein for ras-like GTPase [Xylariales sp. AK1849]|nr:GTPase-activator protein for ras-like GTPase [Xylariales sp. AK1849]